MSRYDNLIIITVLDDGAINEIYSTSETMVLIVHPEFDSEHCETLPITEIVNRDGTSNGRLEADVNPGPYRLTKALETLPEPVAAYILPLEEDE